MSASTGPAVTASSTFDAILSDSITKNISDIVAKYKVPGAVVGIHLAGKGDYPATIGVGNLQTKATLNAKLPWPLRSSDEVLRRHCDTAAGPGGKTGLR